MRDKAELINRIIQKKNYKSYLELGIGAALETVSQIKCDKIVSVDTVKFNDKNPTFVGTTNAYFDKHKEKFDVIYIDAAHDKNQVDIDAVNSMEILNDDGVIFMHDIGPADRSQIVPTASGTAYLSYFWIRANPAIDAFSYEFPNGDVLGIVKMRENPNLLMHFELNFEFYENNRDFILQKKSLEEVLELV